MKQHCMVGGTGCDVFTTISSIENEQQEMEREKTRSEETVNSNNAMDFSDRTDETGKKRRRGQKQCYCTECGKSFTRKSSLIVHQRIHTGEKHFMCTECGKRFGLKSSLVRHMRTHIPKTLNICPDCGKCFTRYSSLFQHQKVHLKERPYRCSHCEKSFARASQLVVHQRIHKRKELPGRSECGKSSNDFDKLRIQKRAEQRNVCPEYGKSITDHSPLRRHQRRHRVKSAFATVGNDGLTHGSSHDEKADYNVSESVHKKNSLHQPKDKSVHAVRKPHSGEKRFLCIDCGKSFTRKSSLIVHQRVHTGEKRFMCTECGKRFGLKSSLVRHMKTHSPKILNICPDCGKCFSRYSSLFQHQKVHKREKPYKCSQCEKSFSRESQLVVHQRTHKAETLYPKSEPVEDSDYPGELNNRAGESHVCQECGKCFRKQSAFIRHQRTHKVNGHSFNTQYSQFHTDIDSGTYSSTSEPIYTSEVCMEPHKEEQSDILEKSNSDVEEDSYIAVTLGDNADMKINSAAKRFLCIDCGKSFTRKSSLIVHQRVHTGEKRFMCTECGKRFGLKSSLVRHMRTHSPKILNICPDCGKCFSRYSSLFQHQKVHKREKPYKCSQCEKSFSRESQLVVHQRTHKAETLYPKSEPVEDSDYPGELNNRAGESHVCQECGKSFRQKNSLMRHQRTHAASDRSSSYLKDVECHTTSDQDCETENNSRSFSVEDNFKQVKSHNPEDTICNTVSEDPKSEREGKSECTINNSIPSKMPYHCIQCGKSFTRKSSLIVHQRIHTGEKLFMCTECGKRFSFKSSLVRHMRTHTGQALNICSECGIYFSRYCDLLLHLESHIGQQQLNHNAEPREERWLPGTQQSVNADKLVVTTVQESGLIDKDQRSHGNEYPLPITSLPVNDYLDSEYIDTGDKIQDESVNIKQETPENICTGQVQLNHNAVSKKETGKERWLPGTQQSVNADKLVVTTVQESGLIDKDQRSHGNEYPLPITSLPVNDYLDSEYIDTGDKIQNESVNIKQETPENIGTVGEHLESHKNEENTTYPYSLDWGVEFDFSKSLIEESSGKMERTDESGNHLEKPMLNGMNNGNLGINFWDEFDQSKRKSQSGEKRFLCTECGKGFTRKSSLIVHQRVHTGEKHFMCTECGKRFGLKSSLVRHMRTHNAEFFTCIECEKSFRDYSKFLQHQTSHTGEWTYTEAHLTVH